MTSTLAGRRVTRARIQIPRSGVWWADVHLDEPETLAGSAALSVLDLAGTATIMAGGP